MGAFKYIPPREVAERHRKTEVKSPEAVLRGKIRPPRQRNVEAVLALGSTRYFTFHNRVYAIPPVPFQLGQRVLTLYMETTELAQSAAQGNKHDALLYFARLKMLVKVMWPHIRMVPRWKRIMKFFGLYRNPFRNASDLEVLDVVNFFLQGRMKSSVQPLDQPVPHETPTF